MSSFDESQASGENSPGKLLMQGRVEAGLTQEQIAKELYMTVAKVKALEADDYSRLNAETFARGYIRAYAQLIKLDVAVVLAAYDRLVNKLPMQSPVNQSAKTSEIASPRGTWQFVLVIAAFFLIIWLISVWFFDNHSETNYVVPASNVALDITAEDQLKQPEPVLATIAVEKSSQQLELAPEAKNSTASASTLSEQKVTNLAAQDGKAVVAGALQSTSTGASATLSSTNALAAAVKKNTLDEITFTFRAESWLEVSDSRGDVLATELQSAGSQIKLVGKAPFDVKLGNAPGVDVQLNGQKIDVVPLMGSNVLMLKVGH